MNAPASTAALALPFDQYQRYRLSADLITILAPSERNPKILELGAADSGLSLFLDEKYSVITSDIDRSDTSLNVVANSLQLPFKEKAFDLALAVDVLEHIAAQDRPAFVNRICAASNKFLVLGFPHKGSEEADKIAFDFVKARHGYDHKFFSEHIKHGLPCPDETSSLIESKGYEVIRVPNAYMPRWLLMIAVHYFMDARPEYEAMRQKAYAFYNGNYYPADNCEPAYRTFLACSRNGFEPETKDALLKLAEPKTDYIPKATALSLEEARLLVEAMNSDVLKDLSVEIEGLNKIISARDDEIEALKSERDQLKDFEQRVRSNPFFRLLKKLTG